MGSFNNVQILICLFTKHKLMNRYIESSFLLHCTSYVPLSHEAHIKPGETGVIIIVIMMMGAKSVGFIKHLRSGM